MATTSTSAPGAGLTSTWFRSVQDRHEGHISAGGVDKDVLFVEPDDVNDEIDAAKARAATIKLASQ